MSSSWKSVWSNALQAAEGIVKPQVPTARATVKAVAVARERRLKLLMIALADGALDVQSIESELKDEQAILEAEFLAIRGLTKKTAQGAAKAIIGTIDKALVQGIDVII